MSLCKACISGVTHEGTPLGQESEIAGVRVYIGTPTVDYPKDKVLLFLTDVFGIELNNNKLLVDDYAKNGFKTILLDYLNNDSIPPDALSGGVPGFSIQDWFPNHTQEKTRPTLDKVIDALKADGVKEFAATGYCFGARYVFDLAFDKAITTAVVSHPSLLQVPADLEKYKETGIPLLINSCTVDNMFPPEKQAIADEILGGGSASNLSGKTKYKREYFDGCEHGFAVRGDLSDPKVKAGKEGAFKAAVEWLIEHF
jgi:dienelactone hydrolase